MTVKRPVLNVEASQSSVTIPEILDLPHSTIPQAQVVGYTETILQRNLDLTSNIVVEQTFSFTPQPVDQPTTPQHPPLIEPLTINPIFELADTILPPTSILVILSLTFDQPLP